MLGFSIGVKDVIDIIIVAIMLHEGYRLLRRSGATNLFWGIMAFVVISALVTFVFALPMTSAIFNRIIDVGAIALIIIFQEEIREIFYILGARFSRMQNFYMRKKQHNERQINDIFQACINMAANKVGALIVLSSNVDLRNIAETGEIIDAAISARLIENIFFKNSPLHDGALLIHKNRLYSAACILPVSKNTTIPLHFGLRHRAAIGITEKLQVKVIVVSEETGYISIVQNGEIETVNESTLLTFISEAINENN